MGIATPGPQPPSNQDWIAPDRVGKPSQVFAQYMASLDTIFRSLISAFNGLPTAPVEQYPIDVSGGSPPSGITANALITHEGPHCGYFSLVSATQCKFAPFNGDLIRVNGFLYQIPTAGVLFNNTNVSVNGVAGQNLAANTNYWAYIFNNNGVLTAEFSTNSHGTSVTAPNIGNEVKGVVGGDTYTLVGLVFTNASAQFVDNAANRNVISWYNRKPKNLAQSWGNTNQTNVNATTGQIYSGFIGFSTWGDVPVALNIVGQATDNCATGNAGSIGFGDNTTSSVFVNQFIFGTNGIFVPYDLQWFGMFNEGAHDVFINGYANTAAAAATLTTVNANSYGFVYG